MGKETFQATLRDVLISVLNTPIPETPKVGSPYDILKDLDAVLPHGGKLIVERDKKGYKVTFD